MPWRMPDNFASALARSFSPCERSGPLMNVDMRGMVSSINRAHQAGSLVVQHRFEACVSSRVISYLRLCRVTCAGRRSKRQARAKLRFPSKPLLFPAKFVGTLELTSSRIADILAGPVKYMAVPFIRPVNLTYCFWIGPLVGSLGKRGYAWPAIGFDHDAQCQSSANFARSICKALRSV